MKEIRFYVTYEVGEMVWDKFLERNDKITKIYVELTASGMGIKYVLENHLGSVTANGIDKPRY